MMRRTAYKGFTIVELLIVIVVIGILAALVLNSFSGAQAKARDVRRTDDIAKIKKALEAYKIEHGQYPQATANPGLSGWERSTDASGSFLEALKTDKYFSEVPVDPTNDDTYAYRYFRYPPGQFGCPVNRGGFYVLIVDKYENLTNKPAGNSQSCPSGGYTDDSASTRYYFHAYEN